MIDAGELLQRGAILDQDAVTCAQPGGDGDRHRRRQAEGAGAGDDEHSGGRHQGLLDVLLQPEAERDQRQTDRDGDEPRHDAVGGALDRRLAGLCILDQTNDPAQGRIPQHAGDPQGQHAGTIEGAGSNAVADGPAHRLGLAGQHRFVDVALPLQHLAIHRDRLAGANQDPLVGLHRTDRHDRLGAIPQHRRDLGLEVQQTLCGGDRLTLGDGLEVTAHEDHEHEVDDRVPIDMAGTADGDIEGVQVGHRRADGDGQVHAQVESAQAGPGAFVEGPSGVGERRRRNDQADPMEQPAKLALIGAGIERDGDPHQVHRREAGKGHAIEQCTILALQGALGGVRIEGHRRIAEVGEAAQDGRELESAAVPFHPQPATGQVDPGLLDTGHRV